MHTLTTAQSAKLNLASNMLPLVMRHARADSLAAWLDSAIRVRCPITDQPTMIKVRELQLNHHRCD